MNKLSLNILFLLLLSSLLFSSPTLSLSLQPANPVEGDQVSVKAVFEGLSNTQLQLIQAPSSPGLKIYWNQNPSRSNNMTMINGVVSNTMSLTWRAEALKEGQYKLPPLIIKAGNDTLKSKSIQFTVSKSQTGNYFALRTKLNQDECFVGEAITLTIEFLISEQMVSKHERQTRNRYELAQNHYDSFVIPEELSNDFHITPMEHRSSNSTNKKHYFGVPSNNIKHNGFIFRSHKITFILEPKTAGTKTIPAFKQNFHMIRISGGFFGGISKQRSMIVSSEAIRIKVKSPPIENKPESFNGIVCSKLSASLDAGDIQPGQKVKLHSPLSIKISLQSDLLSDSLTGPIWSAQKELLKYFDVSHQSMIQEVKDNKMLFKEIIIRPKSTEAKSIPGILFSYFNPKTQQYTEISTEPFPIIVEAIDQNKSLAESPQALLQLEPEQETKKINQISGLEHNSIKILSYQKKAFSWPLIIILVFSPWVLILSYKSFIILSQNSKLNKEKNKFGLQASIDKINKAQNSSELLDIISKFICHRWKISDPKDIPIQKEDLRQDLFNVLDELSAASYAGTQNNSEIQSQLVIETLKKLSKEG